jgi:hypothetical protein
VAHHCCQLPLNLGASTTYQRHPEEAGFNKPCHTCRSFGYSWGMPRRPANPKHPYRLELEATFRLPMSRSCGFPSCHRPITVGLFEKTDFMGAVYCGQHQVEANNYRRTLRRHIQKIESLLADPDALALINDGAQKRLTKEELKQWGRRLRWELNGFPRAG